MLRITEPSLPRPFKVPGGMAGAIFIGVFPTLLLVAFLIYGDHERILGISSLTFGALLVAAGFVAYGIDGMFRSARRLEPPIDLSRR